MRGKWTAVLAAALFAPAILALTPIADSAKNPFSASATVPATAIAAGGAHSCALTSAGGVKCWGWNGKGELGDGTTGMQWPPVEVSGLSGGVSAIAAGEGHSCALTSSGGVRCWGWNEKGQLGDGTARDRLTPVDVVGLSSGVTAIAAGAEHNCALTSSGAVKCWGGNVFGQLGDGTTTDRWTPVGVSGLSGGVRAIAAGGVQSCALTTGGGVKCWGANKDGEVGDGTTTNRLTPVDVAGLGSGVTAIAAGGLHSCALTSSGGVKCWGVNYSGQLGDGTITGRLTPVDVSGLSGGVTAIAAGLVHSCALTSGGVRCWGDNEARQLADGTTSNRSTPVDVSGLSGVRTIATGDVHSCALISSGGVKCWGHNGYGQLGDGSMIERLTPVGVIGFGAARATLAIASRSLVVTPTQVAPVELRCGSQARCQGTLSLSASVNGQLVGSSARRVQVKLGGRTFSIAARRTRTVKVELTARGFTLLVRVRRLPAQVRMSYNQPAGGTTVVTRTITLTAPKRVKR
jgi:alpha-tubulin suppressor-like RCC1 family protein